MWNNNARAAFVEKTVWRWKIEINICCVYQIEWRSGENKTPPARNWQKGQSNIKTDKRKTLNRRVKHKLACSSNEKTQWDVKEQRHQYSWKWYHNNSKMSIINMFF